MAPLRCATKFDPFLSLDCAPTPSTLAQSKERKESNFAIWQPCLGADEVRDALRPEADGAVVQEVARPEEGGVGGEGAQEHGAAHALRQHRRPLAAPFDTESLRYILVHQ